MAYLAGGKKGLIPWWPALLTPLFQALSLYYPSLSLLGFVCLVPLIFALDKTKGWWGMFGLGAGFAVSSTLFIGYWLYEPLLIHYHVSLTSALLFVILFVFLPFFVCFLLFLGGFSVCRIRLESVFFFLFFPSWWVLWEFTRTRLPFFVPWGDIGYCLVQFPLLLQSADFFGVYGLSFFLVLINALVAEILRRFLLLRRGESFSWRRFNHAFVLLGLFFLWAGYGQAVLWMHPEYHHKCGSKKTGTSISVTLVQGNFSLADRWSGMGFYHRIKTYLDLSVMGSASSKNSRDEKQARLIIWPETVINDPAKADSAFFAGLARAAGRNGVLVSGGVFEKEAGDQRIVTNCAYIVTGDGILQRYDKHILLPYAETAPAVDMLGRYYRAPEHFNAGRGRSSFATPAGKIGLSICLEALYADHVRKSVQDEGATLLVNLSNDAWFGRTRMPLLHFNSVRVRAVENRRYFLRAANSGISGIIAPDGCVVKRTDLFTRQAISDNIRIYSHKTFYSRFGIYSHKTFYSRFGDWIVYLSGLVMLTFIFFGVLGPRPHHL